MADIGDNSMASDVTRRQLRAFIERIERLEAEKKTIADDIKDVFAEAKGCGFDTKALREIVKIRKQDADQRAEHEAIVDLYMSALGMLRDTPLGAAALRRDLGEKFGGHDLDPLRDEFAGAPDTDDDFPPDEPLEDEQDRAARAAPLGRSPDFEDVRAAAGLK